MKRTYHGCEVESTLEAKPVEGSDGWAHVVRHDGQAIGDANTLGAAIQIAKHHEVPEAEPEVEEIEDVDPELGYD